MTLPGSQIGLDPIERVSLMENHDEAYYIWRNAGVEQRVLVHIDAHHDMGWVGDGGAPTIANYICPALKENVVKEVYWVVPDASMETRRNRRALGRHLSALIKDYPGSSQEIRYTDDRLETIVMGKPLWVCTLRSLPRLDEPVLLDIDTDFLVIPKVSYKDEDQHSPLPWCWPDRLVADLRAQQLRSDLITIAYSVEGGFTPLKWKYLGNELSVRFRFTDRANSVVLGMELIREAAQAHCHGKPIAAETLYREAIDHLPNEPAPLYHLAYLCAETGRPDEGRAYYHKALTLDPSYRTPYNNAGLKHSVARRLREAEAEYQRVLALDSGDAYAYLGLGRLAMTQKRWNDAEQLLRLSLSLNDVLTDAYRALGKILAKQNRRDEAISAYERSLKTALAGHKPLGEPIATPVGPGGALLDPDHARIHATLAHLYALSGATNKAINGYRISIAGNHDGVMLRCHLALLYLKLRQWQRSAESAWQAVRMIPNVSGKTVRQGLRRLGRMVIEWRAR